MDNFSWLKNLPIHETLRSKGIINYPFLNYPLKSALTYLYE